MESARCNVPAEKGRPHIHEVEHIQSVIRVPAQILNTDETAFCSHPMKGKKKRIVYSMGCGTKAAYRKETDLKQMNLVATMNLLG
jgi:hypothetical protein